MLESDALFGCLCHSQVGDEKQSGLGRVTAALLLFEGMERMGKS